MGYNMVQKIIASHLLEGEMTTGSPITVKVDQTLGHDLTSIMIGQLLCAIDVDKVKVDTYFYCDHNVLSTDSESTDDQLFLKSCARRYGIYYSKPGNGICHFLHSQRFARPGQIILGADSHTPTSGAVGALRLPAFIKRTCSTMGSCRWYLNHRLIGSSWSRGMFWKLKMSGKASSQVCSG